MSCFRLINLIFALLALSACGFQPLYGTASPSKHAVEFVYIQIAPIKDRTGQQLQTELTRRLHASGRVRNHRYRLVTTLNESTSSLAVRKSALATRANLRMSAGYKLTRIFDGRPLFSTSTQVTVSYNILDSEFGTLMAEKDARRRAVKSLSEDMQVRLAVFFRRGDRKPEEKEREAQRSRN